MTIGSSAAYGSAVGSGTTGPFNVPFPLYSQADLTILLVTNSIPVTQALGTDYTFTAWSPDTKGQVASPQVTFTNAVGAGVLIVFLLTPAGTQTTAITNFPQFFPSKHEATFDTLTQRSNQLAESAGKSLKAPDFEQAGATDLTIPPVVTRASMLLGFDASGNATVSSPGLSFPLYTTYAYADLPTNGTTFAMAWTTDGYFAMFNTLTSAWEKIGRVSP